MSEEAENTRAAIEKAIKQWHNEGLAAAIQQEARPDIERVGILAIDAALPHLKPNGGLTRYGFLHFVLYLLRESPDALENSERRKKAAKNAARLIREAAALMEDADNHPLGLFLNFVAPWIELAPYGVVYPDGVLDGQILTKTGEGHRECKMPTFNFEPDAITGMSSGRRGRIARDANIVRAIAQYFPDSQEFRGASDGYSIIANLAVLCGLTGESAQSNPNEYVRSILKKGHT